MVHKLLRVILMFISCILVGCSGVEETLPQQQVSEVVTDVEEVTETVEEVEETSISENTIVEEVEESSILENTVIEEEEVVELKDEITYYDYGYATPSNINIHVNENIVSVYNNEKDITDSYSVYYWVDKNTRIDDSKSMELKENTNSIIYSNSDVDGKWEYIFLVDSNGYELNSLYETRILKVHYVKDSEQLTKKFVMCVPKNSIYYRSTIETEETINNVLTISNNDSLLNIDLTSFIYEDKSYEEFSNDSYSLVIIDYDKLIESYEMYNCIIEFLSGASVSEPIEDTIVTPLDSLTLNEVILSTITYNPELYLKSIEDGKIYNYIIFTYKDVTYETILISNEQVNISNLDYMEFVNKDGDILIKDDYSWLSWSNFYGNEDLARKAIEANY